MHSFCQCSWTCPASTNMQFGAPSIGENLDHEDHTGYALDHTSDYGKPGPHRGAHSAAGETRTLSCLPNFELAPESDPRASLTSVRRHLPGTRVLYFLFPARLSVLLRGLSDRLQAFSRTWDWCLFSQQGASRSPNQGLLQR